ncbi:MAG: aminoacetone oxidase family FAD-binding enzyme, partial [Pseudomonadota bacterium]
MMGLSNNPQPATRNPEHLYDIIVIGAGASGMLAAGRAAELGARVLLLEKMPRLGLKLGITGKGRCNLTNLGDIQAFMDNYSPDGRFLRNCFARFFNQDLIHFFENRGVSLVVERGQRVFPKSNQALEVVSALMNYMKEKGVMVTKDYPVEEILVHSGRVEGVVSRQGTIRARTVILAAGGASYPKTGSTGDSYRMARKSGHTIVGIRPFLVPLVAKAS